MNVTLTRRARALLLFLSASAFIAWFSGLGDRTDAADDRSPSPRSAPTPRFEADRTITAAIVRDPFSGVLLHPPISVPAGASPETPSSSDPPLATRAGPGSGGFDVPDIEQGTSTQEAPSVAVRATIVGANPLAYVENGTTMDIVRTGDALDGERIVKIDLSGLTFADGSRLDLPQSFSAPPAPPPAAISISHQIEQVRKLLASRKATSPAPTPSGLVAPAVSATASYPTPAALPTADARGIPVGTNPTPDASGPTPYPDPYPYSPPR